MMKQTFVKLSLGAVFTKSLMGWVVVALWTAIFGVHPAGAQDAIALVDDPPLVAAVGPFPPYFFQDMDGAWTGFGVDLLRALSNETGIAVEFSAVSNAHELVRALANGDVDTIPGLAGLPAVHDAVVFSTPVATETIRLIAKPALARELLGSTIKGLRIGIVPPSAGSDTQELLSQNTVVEFGTVDASLVALLTDDVDALLILNSVAYTRMRDAGFDHLFDFVDPPVRTFERFVPLHKDRAHLLPVMNAAIARLRADGRLERLARKYVINAPPPSPDVLRVPVGNTPPWSTIDGDTVKGFVPELLTDLAGLANLDIEFIPVSVEEYFKATAAASEDLVPFVQVTDANQAVLDLTSPIISAPTHIIVRDRDSQFQAVTDLPQARVGTIANSTGPMLEGLGITASQWVVLDNREALYAALREGHVDAIATSTAAPDNKTSTTEFRTISPPNFAIDVAIGLRPGLGPIRERLNAVIPGYLLSDQHARLKQQYLAEPIFWTQARIYGALGAVGTAFLALFATLLWQRHRQRKQTFARQKTDLARERAHTKELGDLVMELEQSNRDLDEFAYIASHDLKEPLRGIGINSNFLLREDLPDKARDRALRMNELAGRMEQLISDLLFFSRLGRGDTARVKVMPQETIQSIRADLSEWLKENNAEIFEVGPIPSLQVERVKFKIVLQNLITNAVKYNRSSSKRVEIGFLKEVSMQGKTMYDVIFVSDNGIGISDAHRDKAFRIFSRLNKKQEYEQGSGSGLAFVRRIVEEHGGEVDFTSKIGSGSIFYVDLPLAEPN